MGKYGLHSLCRPCKKISDAERRSRPDQKARQKAWRDANKEYIKNYNAMYRARGYKSTEHVARWRTANLEYARQRARKKARLRREDPSYRLMSRIAARVRLMAKGKGSRRTCDLLGYSMDELRQHLERQFTKGMTWERFMKGEIHIDHIIPVSAFNIQSVDDPDFKACWALTNLRPMWARENLSKNNKVLTLL